MRELVRSTDLGSGTSPSLSTMITLSRPCPPPPLFDLNLASLYVCVHVCCVKQNIHISPRKIWLTRHAESVRSDYEPGEDVEELTEEGRRYSMTVAKYIQLEQVRARARWARGIVRAVIKGAAVGGAARL